MQSRRTASTVQGIVVCVTVDSTGWELCPRYVAIEVEQSSRTAASKSFATAQRPTPLVATRETTTRA